MTRCEPYPLCFGTIYFPTDPVVLSELAEGRARDKIPEMQKSLQGRISEHQQKMLKHQLGHIESLTALIMDLDADIKKKQNP